MAAANGRTSADLNGLREEAFRFNFFQAVRLLERHFLALAQDDPKWRRFPIGQDFPPDREVVRFRALQSLSFPPGEISALRQRSLTATPEAEWPPPELVVTFMGLTGASGVLPYHYTRLILRRLREKDESLREWLDLFNHRLISLFYRAWEKYRLPFVFERTHLDPASMPSAPAVHGLYCLVGLGTPGLPNRQKFSDEALLFYSGHFAHYPRNAIGLECLLAEYFQLPIVIEQLHGQWLHLERDDWATMPGKKCPKGTNTQLGRNVVIGERVWDRQSKFRIRVGPLSYAQFCSLMPDGERLRVLSQLTRTYVGPEFDFDVQPVLRGPEAPWCQLTRPGPDAPRLGWNTWVRCRAFTQDVDDAVFAADEE
jgi:type VI secretion system protein ImpH